MDTKKTSVKTNKTEKSRYNVQKKNHQERTGKLNTFSIIFSVHSKAVYVNNMTFRNKIPYTHPVICNSNTHPVICDIKL